MRRFESLGQYHDLWAHVLLSAPDGFRPRREEVVDQRFALREAFADLRAGFIFVERKIRDARAIKIMRELIEISFEAYEKGDAKTGAHALQECEGMIWTGRRQQVKYAVEAERRAFGRVVTYADTVVSPYPYEGAVNDLSAEQLRLWEVARQRCEDSFARREDFKPFVLFLGKDGAIAELKARSWKSAVAQIHKRAAESELVAFVRAHVFASGSSGVLSFDVEALGRPRASIRCLVNSYACEPPRFHMEDPVVLNEKRRDAPIDESS